MWKLMLLFFHFLGISYAHSGSSNAVNASNSPLIFLTLDSTAKNVSINFVTSLNNATNNFTTKVKNGTKNAQTLHPKFNSSIDDELNLYTLSVPTPLVNNQLTYNINGVTPNDKMEIKSIGGANSTTNLRVCVFGDYRADLYEITSLNLSRRIIENNCNLNLFIGKIAWDLHEDGLSFAPQLMLYNSRQEHSAFANVPSIFGAIGNGLNETTYFNVQEINGVAFIQTTVAIVSIANLTSETEQYNKIVEYFREEMLNELECKLQEIYRRDKKPWIIVYLTHPSLLREYSSALNNYQFYWKNRFFEILKRYKIDLLMSCGIEGMSRLLKKRAKSFPDEQLPTYIQTTLAECGGYKSYLPSLQNECSYTILNIQKELLFYEKLGYDSKLITGGTIKKNTQQPDKCVEHEL